MNVVILVKNEVFLLLGYVLTRQVGLFVNLGRLELTYFKLLVIIASAVWFLVKSEATL